MPRCKWSIHKYSQFETERFVVQVTLERFNAQTKPSATVEPLRDLVLGTFYISSTHRSPLWD